MNKPDKQTFYQKCLCDDKGNLTLSQPPNLPLYVWVGSSLIALMIDGPFGTLARCIAIGSVFTWAWLELFEGLNYFRRVIGLLVMLATISTLYKLIQ